MIHYLIRRLFLLPVTLFAIILVNFVILNLAPGDPVNVMEMSATGDATMSSDRQGDFGGQEYLQFREHYGLTLPVLFNTWVWLDEKDVKEGLKSLLNTQKESTKDYHKLWTLWGDRARFIMPILAREAANEDNSIEWRKKAINLFIRGGTKQGWVGPTLTDAQKLDNTLISKNNNFLQNLKATHDDTSATLTIKAEKFRTWLKDHDDSFSYPLPSSKKAKTFFFETRFYKYFHRIVRLDFGSLRNDNNKTVISEVAKRFKYSLTLALIPMLVTFVLCQVFGMIMAVKQNKALDISLNFIFLLMFALPIFVVAPFLIENIALKASLPTSGFQSPIELFSTFTTREKLFDIILHIFLPLAAIMYGMLAVQARLSRTAILEVLRQDYVKTARAKGLPLMTILVKHVGRNAAITIVTSLATSLGVILGGSLIVETVFEINGFGRFFYEAIVNRDYNVILFSAFAGSLLTLVGYLLADIAYVFLDPRVSYD